MTERSSYQVAVIGGGIAGLVSAALLSKEGYDICIIEKESLLGGCIYSLKKNGHNFQGGAHHLGGLGDGACVNRVLKKIGIYNKDLFIESKLLNGIVDKENFYIPFELKELKIELITNFRNEATKINMFFNELEKFKVALMANDEIKILKYFQKFSKISFNELINNYFINERIKTYLCALGPGYGGITGNGSAFTMMSLLATYGDGAYNIKGGMNNLVSILENYIEKSCNSKIYKNTLVTDLIIENGEVIAIKAIREGETIEIGCKKIIVTSNIINIYKMVSNNLSNKRFHNKINSLGVGPSVLRLFLAFDKKIVEKEKDYIFFPSWNVNKWDESLFYDTLNINKKKQPISMVSFPTNVDETLSADEEGHMFMTILTKKELMLYSKEDTKNKLKEMFYKNFESLQGYEKFDLISTNIDIQEKTLTTDGSVFGWNRGVNEVLNSNIFAPTCMFKNLYVAGNWGPSFGVYGAFYSAEKVVTTIGEMINI